MVRAAAIAPEPIDSFRVRSTSPMSTRQTTETSRRSGRGPMAWQRALAILDGIDHPDADKLRKKLQTAPER